MAEIALAREPRQDTVFYLGIGKISNLIDAWSIHRRGMIQKPREELKPIHGGPLNANQRSLGSYSIISGEPLRGSELGLHDQSGALGRLI